MSVCSRCGHISLGFLPQVIHLTSEDHPHKSHCGIIGIAFGLVFVCRTSLTDMRVPLKLISKSHAIGSLLPKPNIAWQMCESDKFPPMNIKSEVLLAHVCLVSVWDLFLSRLGHLLVEESRCRDDPLAPADLQDDLAEEVSEAALDCRESALPGCSTERAVVRKERSAIQESACYHRV